MLYFYEDNNPCYIDDYEKLGKGGQGQVYKIKNQYNLVAKLYWEEQLHKHGRELEEKLYVMINNPPIDPTWEQHKHHSIAWPLKILYKEKSKRNFAGYVMPFVDGGDLSDCFFPEDRKKVLGYNFNWKYLFVTACNIASAVRALHEKEYYIGDFKEENIIVKKSTLITIIDCDSFQVKDPNRSKIYYCGYKSFEYSAPELIDNPQINLNRYDRRYTDLFALGVIIFKLIMEGTHPFDCIVGTGIRADTRDAKIKNGFFPYITTDNNIKPAKGSPSFEIIPPDIQHLFIECFVYGHTNPTMRPTAYEWYKKLKSHLNIKKDEDFFVKMKKLIRRFIRL